MTGLEMIQRALRLIQVAPPGDDASVSSRTVQDVLKRVLRILSVVDAERELTASQLTTGTDALNDLLTRWQRNGVVSGLNLPYATTATVALTQQAFQALEYNLAYLLSSEFGAPLRQDVVDIAQKEYDRLALDIPHKATHGMRALNEMLTRWQRDGVGIPFVILTAVSDPIICPIETYSAIAYNLAVELAPEYGKEPSSVVVAKAEEGYKAVLRDCQGWMRVDLSVMPSTYIPFDIQTG